MNCSVGIPINSFGVQPSMAANRAFASKMILFSQNPMPSNAASASRA